MAKKRQQKEVEVKDLADKLGRAKAIVFANFEGLKVSEASELRKECRKQGVDYVVAKKTLLKKALEQGGLKDIDPKSMAGGITTVLAYEDEIAPAKVLVTFSKTHEALKVAGGVLENRFIQVAEVINLAKLPSKQELLAKLLGSMQAPMSGLVNVFHGNLRNLVYVLNAVKEKKQ